MSKLPISVIFNPVDNVQYDQDGQVIRNDNQIPRTRLTEKGVINIQLVSDYDDETEQFTKYTELESGTTARALVDNDFSNPEIDRTFITGSGHWVASASGTNEYYYNPAVNSEPVNVYENAATMPKGTPGSLAAGEWGYGDNDSIGGDRVYVRLTDEVDPDTKTLGYMLYRLASGTYTPNFLDSQEFNNPGTWYDADTETWRDPVLGDGELTFEYNANTDNYYDRINADADATTRGFARTTMQMPLYEPGTGEHFDTYEFDFYSYNRYLPDDQIKLDVAVLSVYTKSEVDAIAGGKMDKPSPSVTPGNVAIFAADGVNVEDGGALPTGGGDVTGPGSSTDNALARFDGATGKLLQDGQITENDDGDVTIAGTLAVNDADGITAPKATVDDDPFAVGWDGSQEVPTKNAVYDEMITKLAEDISGLTVRAAADGTETLFARVGGVSYQLTVQKIVDKAIADFPDVELENGIHTPASEIDDDLAGDPIVAYRTKDTAPAEVALLNHMDGAPGDTTIADDSTNGLTAGLEGSPTISDTQEVSAGFGQCLYLDGNDGYDYQNSAFLISAQEFAFTGKFYIADADKNSNMALWSYMTDDATSKILEIYLDGGFIKVRLGYAGDGGDWSDSDSREVVTAGYLNADAWNSVLVQRNGDELQVCLNGFVLIRIDMTGKTLNSPVGGQRLRIGYANDSGGVAERFLTGYVDELLVLVGAKMLDIPTNGNTPTTFTDWTTEQYVTKKYDIDPAGVTPASGEDFLREVATGINLETVADTAFYTVPTGKVLFIDKLEVIIEQATPATSVPEITFGTVTDDDQFVTQQALDASMDTTLRRQVFEVISDGIAAGESIQFSVKVAGVDSGDYDARVGLVGYLIDA